MKLSFEHGDEGHHVKIESTATGYRVTIGDNSREVQLASASPGEVIMRVDGRAYHAHVAKEGARRWVFVDGQTFVLQLRASGPRRRDGTGAGPGANDDIRAPMPGQVWAVQAAEGAVVEQGQTILVLEAMKIELRIAAPRRGRLSRLMVRSGQIVERNQLLGQITSE